MFGKICVKSADGFLEQQRRYFSKPLSHNDLKLSESSGTVYVS